MIKSSIKKIIPKFVIKALRYLKEKLYDNAKKKFIFLKMRKKHKYLLNEIKGKEKVKIIFLVIRRSVWKVDPVFKKMLADPFFEPLILVIPDTTYNKELMWEEMNETFKYFEAKGYPTEFAYKEESNKWTALHEMKPDIIFFTDPHNLTRKEYYEDAYLNYLSCYVPYHHEVGSFGNNDSQHNQVFHNAIWKIFSAHNDSFLLAKDCAVSKGKNILISGFPAMENLIQLKNNRNFIDVWKTNDGRKRIIWSPHHLINETVNQSNFLEYAKFFLKASKKHKNEIVWAFKPHPILKSKLLEHPKWGKEKTEEYYNYWAEQEYTQLELGNYENLFLSSDAMIHDCGSFLAEYMYTEKPVMYLLNKKHKGQFFNPFGKKALNSCKIGMSETDIESFISNIASHKIDYILDNHKNFIKENIEPYFSKNLPSQFIIETLKEVSI